MRALILATAKMLAAAPTSAMNAWRDWPGRPAQGLSMKLQSLAKLIAVVAGLCLPQAAYADTIILTNGDVVYGKILAETMSAFRLWVNCNGQVVFIRKTWIASVKHNNSCGAPPRISRRG